MKYIDLDKNPYYTIFGGLILFLIPILGTFIVMKYFKTACSQTIIMQGFVSIMMLWVWIILIIAFVTNNI